MDTTTTILFQQATVEAVMITGGRRRFEIKVDGMIRESFAATRSWKSEQKVAIRKAQELVSRLPDGTRLDPALAGCGVPLQQAGAKPSRDLIVLDVTTDAVNRRTLRLHGGSPSSRQALRARLATYFRSLNLTVSAGDGRLVISEPLI